MSLKVFHIIFITSSIILDFAFGVLTFQNYIANSNPAYLIMGFLSLVFGAALMIYGIWFLRELKKLK
ncbi:MAG: hypothetical protein HY586_01330 [Candidatus Omnitrophica bacterium]|nr:hypothetical protein [Candidatus Omnitrophota bacterium]